MILDRLVSSFSSMGNDEIYDEYDEPDFEEDTPVIQKKEAANYRLQSLQMANLQVQQKFLQVQSKPIKGEQ